MTQTLWLVSDVARAAGVNPGTVVSWQKLKRLLPAAMTPRGVRLYSPQDVKRFLAQRAKRMNRGRQSR